VDLLCIATLGLARKSQAARQYSDSLRYFGEAEKLHPQAPEPHRRMAEIYTLTGRPAEAMAEKRIAERLIKGMGKVQ
jgi:tRNA A37 N6-isopentenylltransferase MiaA